MWSRSRPGALVLSALAVIVVAIGCASAFPSSSETGGSPELGSVTTPPPAHDRSAPAQEASPPDSAAGQIGGDDHETTDEAGHGAGHGDALGSSLGLIWAAPFAGILLSIAIFPLVARRFWHEHFPKVAFAWAAIFAIPFLILYKGQAVHAILHIYLVDYLPFIILLWGLFTVAGGLVVRGSLRGTPERNTLMLLIGTMIASWVGTTGAAMVMIRPVLRANAHRKNKTHIIVFFIFLVANVGGSLTPLGDPPLFLGFLHGVPFFWTLIHMPVPMTVVAVILLVVFYVLDRRLANRDSPPPAKSPEDVKFSIVGLHNLVLLGGIIGAVLLSGFWELGEVEIFGVHLAMQNIVRDFLIVFIGWLSLKTTRTSLRRENEFSWGPILEVGYLFAGIFMTIIPALEILKAGSEGALAGLINSVESPWQYFWVTGGLSAFLDNAPTYLTFFSTALGRFYPGVPESQAVASLINENNEYLLAIAAGSVFMGACSYIGNAPNFMVKSIAEEAGIEMPSFFGFIVRWSLPILVPIFVLVTFLFFLG